MNALFLICLSVLNVQGDNSPEQVFKESNSAVYLEIGYLAQTKDKEGKEFYYLSWAKCSGFVYKDADGVWVLTGAHCVRNGFENWRRPSVAYFRTSLKMAPEEITLIGYDADIDCALFKLDNPEHFKNFPFARLGSSESLTVGQQVIALGSPHPSRFSQSVGWINNLNFRGFAIGQRQPQLIMHSAAINAGSSGGPLVNLKGEVIGINVMIYSLPERGATAVSLAVPIDDVKFLLPKLKIGGVVEHQSLNLIAFADSFSLHGSDLGALGIDLNDRNRPVKEGLLVIGVKPGSQAELGGFLAGDLVISCNGQAPKDLTDLFKMIYLKSNSSEILKIEIERNGQRLKLPLLLVDIPETAPVSDSNSPN